MSYQLLIIFVKHPAAGEVKTRLAAAIGDKEALNVYQALLLHTRSVAEGVSADKAVFYGNTLPDSDLWEEIGYPRMLQEGDTLGARMLQAFTWGYMQGYTSICIVGSDCLALTSDIVSAAFSQLAHHDAVIGPAHDGGYYLLGMNTLFPNVFQGKYWSTDTVFSATLRDFELAAYDYTLLPTLSDIDTVEDLKGTKFESLIEIS